MRYQQSHVITVSKVHIQSLVITVIAFVIVSFVVIAMLTTAGNYNRFASTAVHDFTSTLQSELFIHVIGTENRHYLEAASEMSTPSLSSVALELATQVNLEDPRTFLGRELPGFEVFDDTIVVAGEGTDLTTMSIESSPPPDAFIDQEDDKGEQEEVRPSLSHEDALVHIVHTHNREAFHPYSGGENYATEQNIVEVGKEIGRHLDEAGIPVDVNEDDIHGMLIDRGLHFSRSYDVSRDVVVDAKNKNDNLEFFIDVHRDSQPHDITTATINGEAMARTFFVVGTDHPDYERNKALATELHYRLEDEYPGLSRGVLERGGAGTNGVFNQDLSPNAMLIEMGGIDNTFDELNRSAEAFATIVETYIYEQLEEEEGE
ncbi:stage II sporulation protein P [Geomicrobium sediminis]|uniref:Stage II sporulation protein P n=1 Tax=Geomicrobium sediminis TaxID=1347788 RepID=A0ABS2PEC1_9BACL|nr:stage II sporulation protein P [Geomicrobium sediminis]MBM7633774.1 stage II sporulation protein P [Geomicrobium sediminis]